MPHTPEQKKAHKAYYREHPEKIPPEMHGRISGWNYYGCTCDVCRTAKSAYNKKSRKRRVAASTPKHVHGTVNGYQQYNCRCERCRYAVSDVYFAGRRLKKDAITGYPNWRPKLAQRDLIENARAAFLADTGYAIPIARAGGRIAAGRNTDE